MKVLLLSIHQESESTKAQNIGLLRIWKYLINNNISCDICEVGLEPHDKFLTRALNGEYSIIGVSSTYDFIEKELKLISKFYPQIAISN